MMLKKLIDVKTKSKQSNLHIWDLQTETLKITYAEIAKENQKQDKFVW